MKLKDFNNLIEYKGDFYTPEELASELNVTMEFDIAVPGDEPNWFEKAMIVSDRKGELN